MTMSLSLALLSGLVAFGTQWPIIDLPYPDTDHAGSGGVRGYAEIQVEEAVVRHARGRDPRGPERRPEISQLRIDGPRATVTVTTGARREVLQLQRVEREWRVIPADRPE